MPASAEQPLSSCKNPVRMSGPHPEPTCEPGTKYQNLTTRSCGCDRAKTLKSLGSCPKGTPAAQMVGWPDRLPIETVVSQTGYQAKAPAVALVALFFRSASSRMPGDTFIQ